MDFCFANDISFNRCVPLTLIIFVLFIHSMLILEEQFVVLLTCKYAIFAHQKLWSEVNKFFAMKFCHEICLRG